MGNRDLSKCKFLIENDGKLGFDEIVECPRFINERDKRVLLDNISDKIRSFGDNLQLFLLENPEVDMNIYFDRYYRKLSSLLSSCESDLQLKLYEPVLRR